MMGRQEGEGRRGGCFLASACCIQGGGKEGKVKGDGQGSLKKTEEVEGKSGGAARA